MTQKIVPTSSETHSILVKQSRKTDRSVPVTAATYEVNMGIITLSLVCQDIGRYASTTTSTT